MRAVAGSCHTNIFPCLERGGAMRGCEGHRHSRATDCSTNSRILSYSTRTSTLWLCTFLIVFTQALAQELSSDDSWKRCDRARCRQARAILDEELFPEIEEVGYRLPRGCPFSRDQDMYYDNEMHKKEARYQNWRCIYCNKVFKTEQFLEKHFENRHPSTIRKNGVCLADYCDVLECDMHEFMLHDGYAPAKMYCNPKTMERRRHRCHSVLDQCFPPHLSETANRLHHRFEELYCKHLSCEVSDSGGYKAKLPHEKLRSSASRQKGKATNDKSKIGGYQKLLLVLGVLLGLMLIIFYLGVWLYRKDMTIAQDLSKLSSSRRQKRWDLLKSKQF